ncbi:deoxyribodipyrimidine photo-lyase, partial [Limnoraphis robusta]|nr:deoxyribodipyrimidine photo-lyase [Limnoraphis robusta]
MAANPQKIILWYRHDLRLHDHEPLDLATSTQAQIIPLYCFDPRQFAKTSFGFPKMGGFRGKFLLESVADLRHNLQKIGSNLLVRIGEPETVIFDLVKQLNIDAVYYHKEVTTEELAVERAL